MKNKLIALSIASIMVLTMSSCRKEVFYGPVMFWFPQNNGTGTVTINGQTGTITGYVTGGVPDCGNAVSANFNLPEGYYSYNASAGNLTWSGTAQAIHGQCQAYELQ